jgi:MFS family permease
MSCNALFLICTIIGGEARNIIMFLVFRFLAGCAGVAPLTIGAGSIGDLFTATQRGSSMAIFSMGPVAGGYITEGWGWRWVFHILSIAVSFPLIRRLALHTGSFKSFVVNLLSFFLNETYTPTLLKAKALRLRKAHSDPLYCSKYASSLPAATVFKHAILRPMKLLFLSPIVSLLSLHMSMVYGYLYLLFTTFCLVGALNK